MENKFKFKIGDKVRVTLGTEFSETGEVVAPFVGKDGRVSYVIDFGRRFPSLGNDRIVSSDFCFFEDDLSIPLPVFNIGDGKYKAEVLSKGKVKVGCQVITRQQLEAVLNGMKEAGNE